jgi:hypothetical protein
MQSVLLNDGAAPHQEEPPKGGLSMATTLRLTMAGLGFDACLAKLLSADPERR